MFTHVSLNRMPVPPPYARSIRSSGHSSLVLVSKIVLSAIAVALAVALLAAVPAKVMVPIATVATAGVVVSFAVVSLDRWNSERRSRRNASRAESLQLEPGEAAGLLSFAVLLAAFFTSAGLRTLLTSAGLFGVGAFRFAAARGGCRAR